LNARFGRFVAAFGGVAAVSAFLLFAGFLSEFGAYRIAGLPQPSFSLTSTPEAGADVAVGFLRECATNEQRRAQDRIRCLQGFKHANDTVDGDDGTADAIVALARSGPGELPDAACRAIKTFRQREGRFVMRLQSQNDPTVTACLARDAAPSREEHAGPALSRTSTARQRSAGLADSSPHRRHLRRTRNFENGRC